MALLKGRATDTVKLPVPFTDSWQAAEHGVPPRQPAVGWLDLMKQCLEKDRAARPTAAQVAERLKEMMSSLQQQHGRSS